DKASVVGILLGKEKTNLLGSIVITDSLLLSSNPGSVVLKGASGSGIYYEEKNHYYLIGVASHVFPALNLLSAVAVARYSDWIRNFAATDNTKMPTRN